MLTRGRGAQASASPDTVLSPLPRFFVRAVLLLLPVDTRLRCSEVSRAWRALLANTTFWECLDVSSRGVARFSEALLRVAVAKDLTGHNPQEFEIPNRLLLEVVAANAATLTELRLDTGRFWPSDNIRPLLEAAPALQILETSVVTTDRNIAHATLRNEPPFQALRLRRLWMLFGSDAIADVVGFSSDLRCHASLEKLILYDAALDSAAAMGAVVDACIAMGLRALSLIGCRIIPAILPELTRLIAAGMLREVSMHSEGIPTFDEGHESTRLFVAAVRASAMTKLELTPVADLPKDVLEAAAFINARQQ